MDEAPVDLHSRTMCVDLPYKQLHSLPENVFHCQNLRMLCLEGNFLEYLPDYLFTNLKQLTWLDVRKNKLRFVPNTIGNCVTLDTLLLQDNIIEYLPIEMGLLSNLKTLQVSGNPITFPPFNVLQTGVHHIVQFLKTEYDFLFNSKKRQFNNSTVIETNIPDIPSQRNNKKINKIATCSLQDMVVIQPLRCNKLSIGKQKRSKTAERVPQVSSGPITNKGDRKMGPKFLKSNMEGYVIRSPTRRSALRVEERSLKDLWANRLRILLEKQACIIQRRKTIEALKVWRQQVDKFSMLSNKSLETASLAPPFDVDPRYLQMLQRSDLQSPLDNKKSFFSKSSMSKEGINIGKRIDQIIESIRALDQLPQAKLTTGEERRLLDIEIGKLNNIQKSLKDLKLVNDHEIC